MIKIVCSSCGRINERDEKTILTAVRCICGTLTRIRSQDTTAGRIYYAEAQTPD